MFLRLLVCIAMVSALSLPATPQAHVKPSRPFSFDQFRVPLYQGPLKPPGDVHKSPDGSWRDDENKSVEGPEVNFAGEYYLAAHSCGTNCRYYELISLRSGRDFKGISMFDA